MLEVITPMVLFYISLFLILFVITMKLLLNLIGIYAKKEMIENPHSFASKDLPEEYIKDFRKKANISNLDYRHAKYYDDEFTKKRLSKNYPSQQH